MTPRQLHALRKRHIAQMQREELLLGILASVTANHSFCAPSRPYRPELFMLHPFDKREEQTRTLTGEEIMLAFARVPKSKESNVGVKQWQ
jgi:hypothetical protein